MITHKHALIKKRIRLQISKSKQHAEEKDNDLGY